MKSPYNWVGNKYKHLDIINKIVKDKQYDDVVEGFMGTGNILLNLECNANRYIGNDKIKLLPSVYERIKEMESFDKHCIERILNRWNRFSSKEDYYNFRKHWNSRYLNNRIDDMFIYETAMLLKMCSNSMVRFNSKGEFNQGFRGLGQKSEFFTENMKNLIINSLVELKNTLNSKNFEFVTGDILGLEVGKNDLIILDPPYILRNDMYSMDYTKQHDDFLLKLLDSNSCDFLYFNYLERDGVVFDELQELIDKHNFNVIELASSTCTGQNRTGSKEVKEVLITNMEVG